MTYITEENNHIIYNEHSYLEQLFSTRYRNSQNLQYRMNTTFKLRHFYT